MKHLNECGESYLKHMTEAWLISSVLFSASLICLIHSIFPFLFQKTASTMTKKIIFRTENRYAKKNKK